jgi:hypothetical protein
MVLKHFVAVYTPTKRKRVSLPYVLV